MKSALIGLAAFVAGTSAKYQDTPIFPRAAQNSTTSAPPTTLTAPPVPASQVNIGRYTVTDKPPQCTASAAAYTTGFWVESNQMNIEDDGGWWDTGSPVSWTFSTNTSGVVFGWPAFPGDSFTPNVSTRTQGNSFTVNTAQQDGGQTLFWQVWNSNGTNMTSIWNNSSNEVGGIAYQSVPFYLDIQGSLPCDHPVGNTSCAANTIQNTGDQWAAYGVDSFMSSYISNNSAAFAQTPFFQKFVKDFGIGDGSACTIQNPCKLIDTCNQLANGGGQSDSPQIWLALQSLQNLSDMLNNIWSALNIGEADTLTQIAQMAMQFNQINPTTTPANHPPLSLSSGALGVGSALIGLFPPAAALSGGLGALSGILGIINNRVTGLGSSSMPDSQYASNQANISQYLGQYVGAVRTAVEQSYTDIFDNAANLTTLLQGGGLVNRTDLNLDCNGCVTKQEAWMEQFLGLKMINQMMSSNNAFITFMPYGTIEQVDTFQNTSFTESDCASNFLQTDEDKLLTVCNTDNYGWGTFLGPGMARIQFYNPDDPDTVKMNKNGYGFLNMSRGPPGYNSSSVVLNTTGTSGYHFTPTDVIESSLRGWLQGGFGFDGAADAANSLLQASPGSSAAEQSMKDMFNLNATSAGMFSIPVCVLTDLNRWPTFWSTKNRLGGDYYCVCYGSKDVKGQSFQDFVSQDLKTITTTLIGESENNTCSYTGQIFGPEGNGSPNKRSAGRARDFFGLW